MEFKVSVEEALGLVTSVHVRCWGEPPNHTPLGKGDLGVLPSPLFLGPVPSWSRYTSVTISPPLSS